MLDGFLTRGARRIEVLRYGVDAPGTVTSVTLRVFYDDGCVETRDADLGSLGFNVESLMALVRALNADLARTTRRGR